MFHDREEFENSRRFSYEENRMLLLIERSHECAADQKGEKKKKNDLENEENVRDNEMR